VAATNAWRSLWKINKVFQLEKLQSVLARTMSVT
jgi:hypothetical protein